MKTILALFFVLLIAACDRPPAQVAEPDVAGPEREVMDPQLAEEARLRDEQEQLARERDAAEADAEAQRSALAAAREWELNQRAQELAAREAELGMREQILNERELESAGRDVLDGWTEPVPDVYHQPVADYGLFYDGLDPYGQWFDSPQYGYIYQPAVVVQDRSWRPYTRGHWVCTDYGWTWMSDEPFGWATYHYGRWVLLNRHGWCWVPGNEWAPSWVAWRHGGGHVGWAPLPPETMSRPGASWGVSVEIDFGIADDWFCFVVERYIAEPIAQYCLPVGRNMALRRAARGCTNLHFRNGRAISGGPSFAELRRHVNRPWSVGRLEMDPLVGLAKRDQRGAHRDGDRYRVFAPNVKTSWNAGLRPSRVAGRVDQAEVVRGRTGMKPEWTERYRETREQQQVAGKLAVKARPDRDRQLEVNRDQLRRAMDGRGKQAPDRVERRLPEGMVVERDPSLTALRERLTGRDSAKPEVVERRVEPQRGTRGEEPTRGGDVNRNGRAERVTPVPNRTQDAISRAQPPQVDQRRRTEPLVQERVEATPSKQQDVTRQIQRQRLEQQRQTQQEADRRAQPQRQVQPEAVRRAQQQQEAMLRAQEHRAEQQRQAQQETVRRAQEQRVEQQRAVQQEAARRAQQQQVEQQREAQQEAARRAQQQQVEQQRAVQQEAARRAQQQQVEQQRQAQQEAMLRAQQQRVEQQRQAQQEGARRAQQQQVEQQRQAQQEAMLRAQQQRVEQQRAVQQEAARRAQQQQLEQQRAVQQEAARRAQQQQIEQQRQAQQEAMLRAQQQRVEQQRQAQQEGARRAQQQQVEQQRQAQQEAARRDASQQEQGRQPRNVR